jgi:hypothetical protein
MSRMTAVLRTQMNPLQNPRCGARMINCNIFRPAKIIFNSMKEIRFPRRM